MLTGRISNGKYCVITCDMLLHKLITVHLSHSVDYRAIMIYRKPGKDSFVVDSLTERLRG